MNNMRRLVLNIMFIANTADGNTNNDINQSVNNNISSTDDSNKTKLYIIASIVVFILGIVFYVIKKERTSTPKVKEEIEEQQQEEQKEIEEQEEMEKKHRTVDQLESHALGDGDHDKQQEEQKEMEKQRKQKEEIEEQQQEEIEKIKELLKELKKSSEVICEKNDSFWNVKTEELPKDFMTKVQRKVIEVFDIMTKIKMNNNSLMNWCLNKIRDIFDKDEEKARRLHYKIIRKIIENKDNQEIFLNEILSFLDKKKDENKDVYIVVSSLSSKKSYIIASLSEEGSKIIKQYWFSLSYSNISDENKKTLLCNFYQKCYEFFTKNSTEFPEQAEFWAQFKEKVLENKNKEEKDRARCMLLAQDQSYVAWFLNPIMLEKLEKKLDDLKDELEQK